VTTLARRELERKAAADADADADDTSLARGEWAAAGNHGSVPLLNAFLRIGTLSFADSSYSLSLQYSGN
jgi:hypothetical protein